MYRSPVSLRQLREVFRLCDAENSGKIKVDYLRDLAKNYIEGDSQQEVDAFIFELDSTRKGALTFHEFFSGVRKVLRRNQQRWLKESMMSPIMATTTDSGVVHEGGAGASVEPRFVISPPESPKPPEAPKSQCSSLSDGESYECYGEGQDGDLMDSGIAADRIIIGDGSTRSPPNNIINRNTWLRTSLRRSSPNNQENLPNRRWGSFRQSGNRQLGSNALASQLYRSSSFNSSGRSSTCDIADDMYSDASLEEDVLDLNNKFQLLQQQVGVLQDSANHNDERYTRAKADNAALQARVIMLEEQLRDAEVRFEDRLQDEQKRSKELMSRLEREKQLQLENATIRLQSVETEAATLKEDIVRQRNRIEKLETERRELYDQIDELKNDLFEGKERESAFKEQERRLMQDKDAQVQLLEELSRELERLKTEARTPALPTTSPDSLRLEELHEEMSELRAKNCKLEEANEELQANLLSAGIEQGRLLTASPGETTLAAELEAMTHDQPITEYDHESLAKIQQTLKEQQDVNTQLRSYIDGILLNIVENYPQLLEVKKKF